MDFYRLEADASRSGWRVTLTELEHGACIMLERLSQVTGEVHELVMWRGRVDEHGSARDCNVVHLLTSDSMRRDAIELLDAYLEDVRSR